MATWLGHSASAAAPSGYLAAIGPTPLRFQVSIVVPQTPLPPLKRDSALAPGTPPEVSPAKPDLGLAAASTRPVSADGAATHEFNEPVPHALFSPTNALTLALADRQPISQLSPQMLVHFFTDGSFTNRQAAVSLPLSFSPALPPPPPASSSATYLSLPKP